MVEGRFNQLSKDVTASLIKGRYASPSDQESLGAAMDVLAQQLTKQNVTLPQDRYARQAYSQSMTESVRGFNEVLGSRIAQLKSVLDRGLNDCNRFRFENLRPVPKFPDFSPPQYLVSLNARPQEPGPIGGLFPWVTSRYQQRLEQYQIAESRRLEQLNEFRNRYEIEKQQILKEVREKTEELEALKAAYLNGDIDAIIVYNSFVLHASSYPQDFPQIFLVGYSTQKMVVLMSWLSISAPSSVVKLLFKPNVTGTL
jgi:restriction system protein